MKYKQLDYFSLFFKERENDLLSSRFLRCLSLKLVKDRFSREFFFFYAL